MMFRYTFIEKPAPEQVGPIIALYLAEGWWGADAGETTDLLPRIVSGSHCFLLALEGDDVVGMGRAISDGASDAYIQDVTVREDRRGRRIGTALVRRIIDRLHQDGLRWIGLIAGENTHAFYRKLGFEEMPASKPMLMKK